MECECGKGERCYLATGIETCTRTLDQYQMQHGDLPKEWVPIYGLDEHPPSRHCLCVDCLPSFERLMPNNEVRGAKPNG